MIVVYPEPIEAETSYDIPLQPVGPFMVLEYVSKNTKRKDYEDNMYKYEHEMKVPYFLLFYPEVQEVSLFHHDGKRYQSVKPNEQGRLAIARLEMEAALLDSWVRFWFRGQLLPLPAELQQELTEARVELQKTKQRARRAEKRASKAEQQAEAERLARLAIEKQLAALQARVAELEPRAEERSSP